MIERVCVNKYNGTSTVVFSIDTHLDFLSDIMFILEDRMRERREKG